MRAPALLGVLAILAAACGGADKNVAPPRPPAATVPPAPALSTPPDPLGPPPPLVLGAPFQPPAPTVYTTANGITVWLLERHVLPVVGVTLVIPTGSSSDPKGEAGLADQAAHMLTEGAGKRGALEFARAIDDLGASLHSDASLDATHVHLGVVKRNFAAAMQLLGDAVVRPRFDPAEWKRLHDLWLNDLKERASDPEAVARVVEASVLYGADHPYGHPVDGLVTSAPRVQLPEAKRFCAQAWRPDRVVVVAVGDLTKGELDAQLDAAFGSWKAPSTAPLPIVAPPPQPSEPGGKDKIKVVLVDRADAPTTVVHLVRPGVVASDPRYAPLYRANIAIGGSFTSRLMQDLREAKGWTYGAGSRVTSDRGAGSVVAGGAFLTDKAVDALGALLADLDDFAGAGMTEDEAAKTRLQARSDIVSEYETVDRASLALAHDAALGLGPDYEAKSSLLSDQADRSELNKLAATFFDHGPKAGAAVVVVGPRAKLEAGLAQAGYGPIEYRDPEGAVVAPPPQAASQGKEPKPAKK